MKPLKVLRLATDDESKIIELEWVQEMATSISEPFVSLHTLALYSHEAAIGLLAPHIRNITCLTLRLINEWSDRTFQTLWLFPQLRTLYLCLERETRITGDALTQLANHCSDLVSIVIGDEELEMGRLDITDSASEEVARALPKLQEFCLHCTTPRITENTILSLGRHCKALRRLSVGGSIDYTNLAMQGSAGLFSNLEEYYAGDRAGNRAERYVLDDMEAFEAICSAIARMMPECRQFHTYDVFEVSGADHLLVEAVEKLLNIN